MSITYQVRITYGLEAEATDTGVESDDILSSNTGERYQWKLYKYDSQVDFVVSKLGRVFFYLIYGQIGQLEDVF